MKCTKEANEKRLKQLKLFTMNNKFQKIWTILFLTFSLFTISCNLLKPNEEKIDIPEGITEEQLQEARYKYKKENAYKEKYVQQSKTDSATITIFNVINYNIRDNNSNIGDGFDYYIFDIGIDNPTAHTFNIGAFTNSCFLSNENTDTHYSNVGMVLKMYYLQSDSSSIDLDYINRFYMKTMPAKEFYRAKLFAFEVSKEDKSPIIFHYNIGNQPFEYIVREKRY